MSEKCQTNVRLLGEITHSSRYLTLLADISPKLLQLHLIITHCLGRGSPINARLVDTSVSAHNATWFPGPHHLPNISSPTVSLPITDSTLSYKLSRNITIAVIIDLVNFQNLWLLLPKTYDEIRSQSRVIARSSIISRWTSPASSTPGINSHSTAQTLSRYHDWFNVRYNDQCQSGLCYELSSFWSSCALVK